MYSCMRYHISPCPALNSGVVDNTSVLRLRLFSSVLRRKKLGLTKLCSLKFGAGHRQLKIFTRKMLFLSLKWRRNFSRFKLHATCTCTSLMAAILWNTNSTGKDTRQCSYEWEMMCIRNKGQLSNTIIALDYFIPRPLWLLLYFLRL